ncbi:MAG TPA: CHAT domain-containing protein [Terriglobales bacterium]|nr:CHAT domain-containing protein [Terriglobales bacterium]
MNLIHGKDRASFVVCGRGPFKLICSVLLMLFYGKTIKSQTPDAHAALQNALRLADLYNWADAAPDFSRAQQLFTEEGDRRNALYARLGLIRATIERNQGALPEESEQLATELAGNPLLRSDKQLRMFAFIVKGDLDTETNSGAMRTDWQAVEQLARQSGDQKWQHRALAQLGIAAFYDGDLDSARKDVGTALQLATEDRDAAGQIRCLTILAYGLIQTKAYEQALAFVDNATELAKRTPDVGFQYTAEELRVQALLGLQQFDHAQWANDELLSRAHEAHRGAHEATALALRAQIAAARKNAPAALDSLQEAIEIGKAEGLTRFLAEVYGSAADLYRQAGDLKTAQQFAESAAQASQESGDFWGAPQRLMAVAELQVSRGEYADADRSYDSAEAFIDSVIGQSSTALAKTAVIRASSEIFTQHFALAARMNDPAKAYGIIEHVRGRVSADLLAGGSVAQPESAAIEHAVSQLRLKLMGARSIDDVRKLRDQIFIAEQARWITPGASILKAKADEAVPIVTVRTAVPKNAVILEYVIAEPESYCLAITTIGAQIFHLGGKGHLEKLIAGYLKNVKSKQNAGRESRALYDALIRPLGDLAKKDLFVVIRDGQLNLVPFDALRAPSGRYIVETKAILYSPSATTFYRLTTETSSPAKSQKSLLAVGGVPYSRSGITRASLTRGFDRKGFADLPASGDEVRIAEARFPKNASTVLSGAAATETAFKRLPLRDYRVLHLAVHGFADPIFPDRAALVLLTDRAAGDDGFLQSSEVADLRFNADLVVLSACETAVGALEGEEGIENLSRAFLLAGARTVISTLWQVDDDASLFLMKHFYAHLAEHQTPTYALTAAKRDFLRIFGSKAIPFDWAAFGAQGEIGRPIFPTSKPRSGE